MEPIALHPDRLRPACVRAGALPWQASPRPGVGRRMLERIGGEVALATSIVRYEPGSRFDPHTHEAGEEFLVLEGVFCDEHDRYPRGTYVRNPPGSRHGPFSGEGCVIFVKLRQMPRGERARLVMHESQMRWLPGQAPGHRCARLFSDGAETVTLERLEPGCTIPARNAVGGEEILVIEGSVTPFGADALDVWSWLRDAGPVLPALASPQGALLWIKRGHLRA